MNRLVQIIPPEVTEDNKATSKHPLSPKHIRKVFNEFIKRRKVENPHQEISEREWDYILSRLSKTSDCFDHAVREFFTETENPQWLLVYGKLQEGSKSIDYFDYDSDLATPEGYHSASAAEATYTLLINLLREKQSLFGQDLVGCNDEYGQDLGEPVVSIGIKSKSIIMNGHDFNSSHNIGRMLVYKLNHKSNYWRK